VEKAIANLKAADLLSPAAIRNLSHEQLAALIRPSGYYNAKARKLRAFVDSLGERFGDDLGRLFALDTPALRRELLSMHGIGPETADSIILYAAGKPIFVVDAYTIRLFSRLGLLALPTTYEKAQALFMANLPPDVRLFNEYHALIVRHAKSVCRKRPASSDCMLSGLCPCLGT